MIIILNEDPVYLSWIRRHRNGFVLDTRRKASKRNTTLHRASCAEIRTCKTKRTRWTTGGRVKACSEDRGELTAWAHEQIGGEPRFCAVCDPAGDTSRVAASQRPFPPEQLTKLENDIVSAVVESAVIHLDNDLPYQMTVGDVAQYLSKTPAQISAAIIRLVSEQMLEIDHSAANGDPLPSTVGIFPTAASLCTVPAFADLDWADLQDELASLHIVTR